MNTWEPWIGLKMTSFQLNQELAINRESGKKHQESGNEKLMRKFKENPLIPIGMLNDIRRILKKNIPGCLLTTGFLINGLFKFGRRDMAGSQTMMRGRILAQVGAGGWVAG